MTNNATQNAIRTGDNNVDNVERVQIDNPNAGTYTITISHKGSLQLGPQNYSLVVTGIVSDYSLTVLNPSQEACSTDSIVYNVDYFENVNGITNITADNVPAGASVLFSQTVLTNSTNFTATIDNLDGLAAGEYSFDIVGNNGNETKRKTVSFTLYTPNLDDPILLAPLTGSTDAGTTNTFTWSDDVNARDYDLEISLDPSFPTNAIFFTTNTISNSVTVNNFNLGTIYYWRVRANNTCTTSNYLDVYNFQVGTEDCSFTYTNNTVVPINNLQDNSGSFGLGNGWSVSTINVPDDINISDVIITTDITHTYIADLILFGVSPNRSNILLNGSCGAADNINATFTDSGAVLNCGTNPAVSGNVIPEESLSEAYFGEDSVGEWAFATNDNFNGDNGSINSWTLNICGIVPITTIPNFNNNLITVATNSNYTIINTDILATTNSEAPVDQIYVVTQDTQVGTLSLNGVDLNVGDTYTQEDVDTNKLTFSNTETTNNTDQYRVDILNASSGFLGNQIININIDSTLSLNDNNFNNTIGLWPNPVNDGILNIQFKKVNNGVALINIFDLQGRKVLNSKLSPKSNTFSGQINVGALSTGVYLVEINYDGFSTSKKIIIK